MKVSLIQSTAGSDFDENYLKSKKFLQDSLNSNQTLFYYLSVFFFYQISEKLILEWMILQ